MRVCVLALTGLAWMMDAAPALAQQSGPWLGGGVGQRDVDLEVSGVLRGGLVLTTPFERSKSDAGSNYTLSAGYDHQLGGGFFVGVEGSVSLSGVEASMAPVTSNAVLTQPTDILICPPGAPPLPCMIIPGPLITFREDQSLAVTVEENTGAGLHARFGFAWGDTKVWANTVFAAQGVGVDYALPALLRTLTQAGGGGPTSSTTILAAETRSEKDTLMGYGLGAGIEHAVTPGLSLAFAYQRTDFDDADFFDTARVTDLRVGGVSESADISLRWRF